MKSFFKTIVIPVVSALVGGAIVLTVLKMSPNFRAKIVGASTKDKTQSDDEVYDDIIDKQNGIRHHFDNLFDDDFFGRNDAFDEMKKMREQMEKRMEKLNDKNHFMSNPFDVWFSDKFGGGTVNDISKREDDNFVYYDIKIEDLNSTSIKTKIEDGYITITGTIESKSGSANDKDKEGNHFSNESIYKSTFSRTFPLPEQIDQNKMEMIPEKNKIVLKFPKVKV